jgi:hypothetical protein
MQHNGIVYIEGTKKVLTGHISGKHLIYTLLIESASSGSATLRTSCPPTRGRGGVMQKAEEKETSI